MRTVLKFGMAMLLMMGMSTAMLYAGGSNESQTSEESGPVQIEFWHEWAGDKPQQAVLNELMADFSESHDNITATGVYMGQAGEEKLTGALAAGNAPEMAWIKSKGSKYYEAGRLMDMDTVYGEFIDRSDVFPRLLEESQYLGEDISLPFENSNLAVLYDETMLAEQGVEPPKSSIGEQWTMDEFISAAREFTDVSNNQYGWEPRPKFDHAQIIFHQLGGRFLSDDQRTNLIVSDPDMRQKMVRALEVVRRMFVTEQIAPVPKDDQRFGNYDMPLEITGPWDITRNAQEPIGTGEHPIEDLGVSPYPLISEDAEPATLWYAKNMALFKTTPAREQATREFVGWFYDTEPHARWAAGASYLPVMQSAAEHEIWKDYVEKVPPMEVFLNQMETMHYPAYASPVPYGPVNEMFDAVMLDEKMPEEAVADYVEDAQRLLDEFWARQDR
jgi:multiple sugar transport system substrate-binding protein